MSEAPRFSIVVPVFNEAATIGEYCRRARTELPPDYELLICYDFEQDTTLPALAALPADAKPARIRLIQNDLGPGVRYAIEAGMRAAEAPVVVVMMVDCSDDFGRVEELVTRAESGAEVVCASRYMTGGRQIGGPRLKGLMSRTAGVTLHWLTGLPTHDPTNSFKAYRKDFLTGATIESTAGFCLGMELTVKAHFDRRGRVEEVPAVWRDRTAGESRFRLWKWLPSYLHWYVWSLDRSRRADLLATGLVLLVAFLLGVGSMILRPDLNFTDGYVNFDKGNQLYRADRLGRGELLYRDVASQYGPLSAYPYVVWTRIFGNTILANKWWHMIGSLVVIAMAFRLVRQSLSLGYSLAAAIILFLPMMLVPGGTIGNATYCEHVALERVLLLAVMLMWRPPLERSAARNAGIGLVLGAWQAVKFGGPLFAGAALVTVDLLCLYAVRNPVSWRNRVSVCLKRFVAMVVVLAALESVGIALAFSILPSDIAWDTIWPAYMRDAYVEMNQDSAWFWNFLRNTPLHWFACVFLSGYGLWLAMRFAMDKKPGFFEKPGFYGLFIGPLFYLWGSFGYLGHGALHYQFAWVMAPAVAWTVCQLRPRWQIVLFALFSVTFIHNLKVTLVDGVYPELVQFALPNGEIVYMEPEMAHDLSQVISTAEMANIRPGHFVVTFWSWSGGGFHYFYNPNHHLRSFFLGCVGFRPYDEAELIAKLDQVDALILETSEETRLLKEAGFLDAKLRSLVSEPLYERLRAEFDTRPLYPYHTMAILVRRSPLERVGE